MKKFLTIAICAAICSIHPAAISTGQFEEVRRRAPAPVEQTVLSASGSRWLALDTAKLDVKQLYVWHFDKAANKWVISFADGLNGADVPTDPDKPDPELSLLDQVRNNFGADQELFESQLTGLIKALDLSRSEGLTQKQLNVYVQGKMEIAFGDYAHNWKPWTDWFLPTAVRKTSLEDYKAWVEEAAESLVAHCDSGFAEVQ